MKTETFPKGTHNGQVALSSGSADTALPDAAADLPTTVNEKVLPPRRQRLSSLSGVLSKA